VSTFGITKIVILQSLEKGKDLMTGEILRKYIECEVKLSNSNLPVELVDIENFLEFEDQVLLLIQQASQGIVPLLHIECHGGKDEGLEFSNGSTTSWSDAAELITKLNVATQCNLFVAFSCCYGAHFFTQISKHVDCAPALIVLGPVESAYPDELLNSMRNFYKVLVSDTDFANAVIALDKQKFVVGGWHLQTAEQWYEKAVLHMLKTECSHIAIDRRARRIHKILKGNGTHKSIGQIKRFLKTKNHDCYGSYFDTYFLIDKVSANRARFESFRIRLKKKVYALKETGKYLL
jgi:hypothetical protein